MKIFSVFFFLGGRGGSRVGGRVCTRLVGLQVIAGEIKIYYLHVGKFIKHLNLFHVLIQQNLFILPPTGWERCRIIKYCVCQTVPLLA
jgi:hypothetical protein